MRKGRFAAMLLSLCFVFCLACTNANAAAEACVAEAATEKIVIRASGRFSMNIAENTLMTAGSSFPMSAGETIRINAVYTPSTASVDFGFIAPNGVFYYINTTDGSFGETITVSQTGSYTLAIRNNSSAGIGVSGVVTY